MIVKKAAPVRPDGSGRVQGLRRELPREYYIRFSAECKPNPDGKGGFSVSGWALALTTIGAGWLVRQLFRLVEWIERS